MADLEFELPVTSVLRTIKILEPIGNLTDINAATRVVMKGSALLSTLGFERVDESEAIHTLLLHICIYISVALLLAYLFHTEPRHDHTQLGKYWKSH